MAIRANYPDTNIGLEIDIVGRVMGPDLHGAHYVAVSTITDDVTISVRFVPLPAGESRLYRDDCGQLRIPRSAIVDGHLTALPSEPTR